MSDAYTLKALSPLRKVIAARMSEAARTIPHFRVGSDIQVDPLIELRRQLIQNGNSPAPSLNDLLIKVCAQVLMEVPELNTQWTEDGIRQFHTADISVVVPMPGGVATPIIRSADAKSVWQVAREVREMAARAARNALKLEEIQGGSFTISNLGMHGVDQFDAIINAPQCAVLAVGAAKPQAIISAEGAVKAATVMRVTLAVDHRAIDGISAARFVSLVRERIVDPGLLCQKERTDDSTVNV